MPFQNNKQEDIKINLRRCVYSKHFYITNFLLQGSSPETFLSLLYVCIIEKIE